MPARFMQPALDAIAAAGFKAYMRDPKDTYAFFTDGARIGYLEWDRRYGAFKAASVHVPNRKTGTGFALGYVSDLSPAALERLISIGVPAGWSLTQEDRESVRKWRDWDHFANSSAFNKEYAPAL